MPPFIIIAGIPGSGKTTLGHALARHLHATICDRDTVMNAIITQILTDAGAHPGDLAHPAAARLRNATYQAPLDIALENHAAGNPVILIAPYTHELTDPTWLPHLETLTHHPITLLWIDTPTDIAWQRRITRGTPRDHALTNHPTPRTENNTPPIHPHTRLDGTAPLDQLTAQALTAINAQ